MNNILEMIKNEKVDWKKLGDVCEILDYKRKPITKSKRVLGEYPYYGANGIQDYVKDFIFDGTFILMGEDGSVINKNNTPVLHWVENSKIWVNNHAHVLGKLNSKYILRYIYYYLSTVDISSFVKGTPPKINQGNMKKIDIPIPSIETQEKIVEILDNFVKYSTELQAELQAELQNRSSQYEYFRDLVLSEDYLNKLTGKLYEEQNKKVEITTLGEVANINRGSSPRPISKYITEDKDGVPWIKIGDTEKNSKYIIKTAQKITKEGAKKSRILKKGDFIISNSMSFGRPYVLAIEGAIHDGWASVSNYDEFLNTDFLYHYLNSSFVQKYWENKINSSSVSNLNSDIIKSLPIPILKFELQIKVSEVLDKFQNLISDAEGLLPEEIEQRQKQYEYYREKLLTFENNMVQVKSSQVKSYSLGAILKSCLRLVKLLTLIYLMLNLKHWEKSLKRNLNMVQELQLLNIMIKLDI